MSSITEQLFMYSDGVRARLTVHFLDSNNEWIPCDIIYDTGSDLTVLPYSFATKLQWFGPQIPLLAREVVGSVAMLKTDAKVALMGKIIEVPIITSAFITEPLLGMTNIKDNFIFSMRPDGFTVTAI